MASFYTNERNHQILIALLKEHNIRTIVASPGIANSVFVGSIQHDPFFKLYSVVDERSAAYMACGIAAESGEPVVISCTGATAARNYMPGMTEAYYSKLPILCITSSQPNCRIGHLQPQVTDRTAPPPDVANVSLTLSTVCTPEEEWECQISANKAILALKRNGGGPVHINLITAYKFSGKTSLTRQDLPPVRKIDRITAFDPFPALPNGRIGIYVGSHKKWDISLTRTVEQFCESNNAVVFCDHTSNYNGKYKILFPLAINQSPLISKGVPAYHLELLIHIGEVSGEENAPAMIKGRQTWRVSEDGEIRDWFRNLSYVFQMTEQHFFAQYAKVEGEGNTEFWQECDNRYRELEKQALNSEKFPLSNVWLAQQVAPCIPQNSFVVLSILNTLRTWNYARFRENVEVFCPVGGFGIDGVPSLLIGAAINHPERLCFGIIGDLAFFYDMNSLGNRHVTNNLRIILVNNGCGVEFKKTYAMSYRLLGEDVNPYVAAAGHFGNKSPHLVKDYVENLGFQYLSASTKEELKEVLSTFTNPAPTTSPMLLEVFVEDHLERKALDIIHNRH